jgi:hypothetical protein
VLVNMRSNSIVSPIWKTDCLPWVRMVRLTSEGADSGVRSCPEYPLVASACRRNIAKQERRMYRNRPASQRCRGQTGLKVPPLDILTFHRPLHERSKARPERVNDLLPTTSPVVAHAALIARRSHVDHASIVLRVYDAVHRRFPSRGSSRLTFCAHQPSCEHAFA